MEATPGGASRAANMARCPEGCRPGGECGRCGGVGYVSRFDAEPPACMGELAGFLEAWAFVERDGLAAWMTLNGEPSQEFLEARDVLNGELARLEHQERVEEARAAARKR